MFYSGYHFVGMHLLWWFFWALMVYWFFAIPYDIPGQRSHRESPLEILRRRFAEGRISKTEFEEKKTILEDGVAKMIITKNYS